MSDKPSTSSKRLQADFGFQSEQKFCSFFPSRNMIDAEFNLIEGVIVYTLFKLINVNR
jgi:hypothetical protein